MIFQVPAKVESLGRWIRNSRHRSTTNNKTDTCNASLRGELSAIETYTQAIDKFAGNSVDSPLERIRSDHEADAASLHKLIVECGKDPATSYGSWGSFATAVEGVDTLIGGSPALSILQKGEEHGISEYEDALADDDFDKSISRLIRDELLPAQRKHLVALERLYLSFHINGARFPSE